jgi:hypothetical protein
LATFGPFLGDISPREMPPAVADNQQALPLSPARRLLPHRLHVRMYEKWRPTTEQDPLYNTIRASFPPAEFCTGTHECLDFGPFLGDISPREMPPAMADNQPPPPSPAHRGILPQSPLRIKQDGKFYERLLTKESSGNSLSFRYYWAEPGSAVRLGEAARHAQGRRRRAAGHHAAAVVHAPARWRRPPRTMSRARRARRRGAGSGESGSASSPASSGGLAS